MTLIYGKYTITGTVDEIRDFIRKETPCTVSGTTTAIIKESDNKQLPEIVKCPYCNSENVIAYNDSGILTIGSNKLTVYYKCNDCGKYFDVEV